MNTQKITIEQLLQFDFNSIIWIAAPIMFLLVALEYYLSLRKNLKNLYGKKDFLASLSIGLGNLLVNALCKVGLFYVVVFFYNLTPFSIPPTWWSYLLCLVALDFFRYWAHRIAHEQRFWWSTHVVHHSSEHYNFSVSFRLSWTQNLKLIFFMPIALMGFHPLVFFITHQIEVLYQFWIHTELIRKLPRPIEYIFTTPSHHRVHHAVNEKYIDKNYGSTFIIWDRMFGTFQKEEEPARYGITKPVNSFNPFVLVFHAWGDLLGDLAKRPRDAWRILFGSPTSWERSKMKERELSSEALQADSEGRDAA
ncbi:MAG: sterol desaturase family protein [Cyclobacteriaceae bacterium]